MSLVSRISATFAQVAADIKACAKRVVVPEYLTANRILTAADSGGTFIYNGGAGTSITTMLASIRGRVRTSATAGSLAFAAGALTALGAQTVAAGAASMSVSKVYDQDRT